MTIEREMQHKLEGDMNAQLEKVLDAYAAAEPGPSRTTLAAWVREYPQFARELTDFTARWQLLKWMGDDVDVETPDVEPEALEEEDELLVLRGVSAAQSVFYAKRAALHAAQIREARAASPEPSPQPAPGAIRSGAGIDSLIAAAGRVGLTYAALKERVGLSDVLLQKLNRRLIDPLTIPVRVIADLAAALHQQDDVVASYVALSPVFSPGAQHRASQAPTLPRTRENFFDAVRNDVTLSDARRRELLALLQRPGADGVSGEA